MKSTLELSVCNCISLHIQQHLNSNVAQPPVPLKGRTDIITVSFVQIKQTTVTGIQKCWCHRLYKIHHDHQTKHRTVLLTNWEDFNAGTDQSTFKGTLALPNPPSLFNIKVNKQTCEHFFHLWVALFTVCQLYICDTLVPSSSFQKTRDAETEKQVWGWLLGKRKQMHS